MPNFMPEPSLTLDTIEDVRAALANPDEWYEMPFPRSWRVKSQWLIGLIDEYAATGKFPYNAEVQRLAEARLGIPRQDDNGSALSRLVYNAQRFRRSDQLRADGYAPLTQAMIEEVFARRAHIELMAESVLGNPAPTLLNVREIDGGRYAMLPRKRKWAVKPDGQPAKIVE